MKFTFIFLILSLLFALSPLRYAQKYDQHITIKRGDYKEFVFRHTGNVTASDITFVVKLTKSFSSPRLIQKANDDTTEISTIYTSPYTYIRVKLLQSDTRDFTSAKYFYDIVADSTTIFDGELRVQQDVQTPFDGTTPPTSGVRFYVAGTFIDSTVTDSSLFRYDSTTNTIKPISKADVWRYLSASDSISKYTGVFAVVSDFGAVADGITDCTEAFENALASSDFVKITKPGTYILNHPVYLSSNKTIEGADGVILKRGSSYSHIFVNDASAGLTEKDTNIVIRNIIIDDDSLGVQSGTGLASPTANGILNFCKMSDLKIENVTIINGGSILYGIHLQEVETAFIKDYSYDGWKDGCHISGGCINITVDGFFIDSYDDSFAIMTSDYPRSQGCSKDINKVTIKNGILRSTKNNPYVGGCIAFIASSWLYWQSGNSYDIGHQVTYNGRIYKMVNAGPLTASVAPAHTSGDVTGADGIKWRYMNDGSYTESNVYNVIIENVDIKDGRGFTYYKNNNSYDHTEYPGTENTSGVYGFTINDVTWTDEPQPSPIFSIATNFWNNISFNVSTITNNQVDEDGNTTIGGKLRSGNAGIGVAPTNTENLNLLEDDVIPARIKINGSASTGYTASDILLWNSSATFNSSGMGIYTFSPARRITSFFGKGFVYDGFMIGYKNSPTFSPSAADPTNALFAIKFSNGNIGIGTTDPKSKLQVVGLPVYANNDAAIAGGLTAGAFYRTGGDPDIVCVVH